MRNESDLAGVKSVARMLLMATVAKTDYSPMVVQYPFANTGIIGIPSESYDSQQRLRSDLPKIRRAFASSALPGYVQAPPDASYKGQSANFHDKGKYKCMAI